MLPGLQLRGFATATVKMLTAKEFGTVLRPSFCRWPFVRIIPAHLQVPGSAHVEDLHSVTLPQGSFRLHTSSILGGAFRRCLLWKIAEQALLGIWLSVWQEDLLGARGDRCHVKLAGTDKQSTNEQLG